jgi:hypothetical protein
MNLSSFALLWLAGVGAVQAQTASAPEVAKPLTQQQLFAQHCPARVQTLLAAAIPASRPTPETVASICACAQTKLDAVGAMPADESVPKTLSLAALSCAKPVITSHNQGFIAKQFGPYLWQQGWKDAEVTQFSNCFAETHWQQTFEAGLQNHRNRGAKLDGLWGQCAMAVGHADTPQPKPTPAALPASSATSKAS